MKLILFVLFVTSSAVASSDLNQKLSGYIEEFNLKPLTPPAEKNQKLFALGSKLFHEKALSGNKNISCLECHHPRALTHDGIPLSLGEGAKGIQTGEHIRHQAKGKILARNTPALFNLHNINVLFWDGRVEMNPETKEFITPIPLSVEVSSTLKSALGAQALFPLVDHDEMRGQKGSNPIADAASSEEAWELIVQRLKSMSVYEKAFSEVFPGEKINIGHVGLALAEFQAQNFFFADTPFDRYIKGNITALTPRQKLGMDVFFSKGKCGDCHHSEHLSALDYDGVGAPQIGPGKQNGDDFGRLQWDQDEGSRYAFRVPPLRNIGLTAPYFHNGSILTLEAVVEHYDDIKASLEGYKIVQQFKNYLEPLKDHDHSTNEARYSNLPEDLPLVLNFTEEEEEALVDFLRYGLTDVRLHGSIK